MTSIYTAKKEIIEVCRRIWVKGYVASNDGNVSVKIAEDRILATPTGMSKGFLEESDLVVCDMEGNRISGTRNPSSEIKMHLMVYRRREDVNAVVHAHPPIATGFAVAGIPLAQCVLPEVIISLGSIPLAEYGTPSTSEIYESIEDYIEDYDAFLLENHGALTIGPDVMNAYYKMETLEHFAYITLVARLLGKVNVLSEERVQKLMQVREKLGIRGRNPGCETCTVGKCEVKLPGATPPSPGADGQEELVEEITRRVLSALGRR